MSKKCQYALRAVFELALRDHAQPVKVHEIAGVQNIPPRFLEVILNQLRQGGFVESRRGQEGGYMLARESANLTVGEVIRYMQGPISFGIVDERTKKKGVYFYGDYAFKRLWQKTTAAISEVCDKTTFAELVEYEKSQRMIKVPNFSI
jgi:Rrf2 family protein